MMHAWNKKQRSGVFGVCLCLLLVLSACQKSSDSFPGKVSSYPDDDGGYLRLFIGAYMQHPITLSLET